MKMNKRRWFIFACSLFVLAMTLLLGVAVASAPYHKFVEVCTQMGIMLIFYLPCVSVHAVFELIKEWKDEDKKNAEKTE